MENWTDKTWRALSPANQAREIRMLPCDSWKITKAADWYDRFAAHKAFNLVSQEIRDKAANCLIVDGDCQSLADYISLNNSDEFSVVLGLGDSYDEYIINGDDVLVVTGCDGSKSPSSYKSILPSDGKITFAQAQAIYTAACTIRCAKCGKAIVLNHLPDGNGRVCDNCADSEGSYE
jgi:hypothetical protein